MILASPRRSSKGPALVPGPETGVRGPWQPAIVTGASPTAIPAGAGVHRQVGLSSHSGAVIRERRLQAELQLW